uniref:non-specific serine/threonine protein kinase n=1 Tax=Cacopsylla melanoneura TaxID=428564 RepID=A0A8D9AR42_9HEMI
MDSRMDNINIIATTIRQRVSELQNSKIPERKKGIDGLKEYLLCEDDAIKYLNETSTARAPQTIKWEDVFSCVKECLIEAIDGPTRAKKTSKDLVHGAKNLIWTIISKANCPSYIHVSSTKLLNFIFEVWETPQLKRELDEFCCALIVNELLEKEIYWSRIGSDKWTALAQIAFDLHSANNSQDCKFSLTILLRILKHGTRYSTVGLFLKKRIFTFLVDILEASSDLTDNDFLKNNMVSYLVFMSTELGPESKAALCKAGEQLLPRLVRLIYGQQKTGPTLPSVAHLYRALLSQFNAHHPLGIDCKESTFAGDTEKWRDILRRVYFMIEQEIERLQRSKETDCNANFVHLAVHLIAWFYQDTEESSLGDVTVDLDSSNSRRPDLDTTPNPRTKRIKLTVFRIENIVQLLQQSSNPYDIWPLLHLVAALVYRYPSLITHDEYKTLLQLFSEYQRNNFTSNEKIMDYLYEAFFAFLLALKHVKFPTGGARSESAPADESARPEDSVSSLWKNVFQNTIKVIGLNQFVRSSHLLLRYLLSHWPEFCETDSLLANFTDKIVSYNEESLKTLFYLVSKVQTNTETRLKLIDWLIPGLENSSAGRDSLCPATLFVLCSNTKPVLETTPSELDHFFGFLRPSSLEYLYATNNFDQGLFTHTGGPVGDVSKRPVSVQSMTSDFPCHDRRPPVVPASLAPSNDLFAFIDGKQIIFNETALTRLNDCFKRSMVTMSTKHLTKEVLDGTAIHSVLNTLSTWISFSKYIDMLPASCKLKKSLRKCLPEILSNVLQKLSRLNLISSSLHATFSNMFQSVNQSRLDIVSSVSTNVLETYLQAIGVNHLPSGNILEAEMPINKYTEEMKDLNFHKLSVIFSDKQLIIFRHVVLLTQYACKPSTHLNDNQKIVLSKLFDLTEDYLSYGFKNMHLLSSTYVIQKLVHMDTIDVDLMEACVKSFLLMCQTWPKQSDVVEYILLPLLSQLLYRAKNQHESFRENLLSYLTKFYTLMKNEVYGPSVQVKIVECFGLLATVDPKIDWTVSSDNCLQIRKQLNIDSQPLVMEMLALVQSPFHCVRMKAIQYLPFIFQSSTSNILKTSLNVDDMFALLTQSIEEILLLDDNFTESEYVDESVNRTASFLHSVACLITSCPMYSRQLLNYTFTMFVKKKLNVSLFKKLLFLILKDMNVTLKQLLNENITYILTCWYETFQTFRSFPTHVLSMDNETFFKENLLRIITILYVNNNTEELKHYAKLVSVDVNALLLNAAPQILALKEDTIVSGDFSASVIGNKLESIVIELVSNVTDYKYLAINACVPQSCSTDITFNRLRSHLELLKRKLDLEMSPVQFLCQNQAASILRILLHLSRYIFKARSFEFRIEALHRYEIFLQLLKPVFTNHPDDLILDFVVHNVVHTLLHTLGCADSQDCSLVVLNCLTRFLENILPQCSEIVVTLLPYLVGSLIPLTLEGSRVNQTSHEGAQRNLELKKKSLNIIELLVVKHSNLLGKGIVILDPFPQIEEYTVMSKVYNDLRGYLPCSSLSKEIHHFVTATVSNQIPQQCRLQGLSNINHLLTHQRNTLNNLNSSFISMSDLKKLEKMMNSLTGELSDLARSPHDEISHQAVVCLGKIGPFNINPTVLASNQSVDIVSSDAHLMLTHVIASNLIQYLSGKNVEVVSIASKSLFCLLNTPEGGAVLNRLSPLERKLIYPFIPVPTGKKGDTKIPLELLFDERKVSEAIDVSALWVPNTPQSHENWISNLTSTILSCFHQSKCYKKLIELCMIQTDFAEAILKYLIYFMLRIPSRVTVAANILSNRLRDFFSCLHRCVTTPGSNTDTGEIHLNKKSVKCLLDVIHFVRMRQDSPDKHLLHVNYLHVAQAAMYVSAPYSAIMFAHLATQELCTERGDRYHGDQCLPAIDYICNHQPIEGSNLQDILRSAYTEIGDLDAVLGCGHAHLNEMASLIGHYKNTNNWYRVIACSDILLSNRSGNEKLALEKQMQTALTQAGLYYTQKQTYGQDFESSWRLSQWDCPDPLSEEPTFETYHYKALKCLNQGETVQCLNNINVARKSVVNMLTLTDMECTKQVQAVLSKLRMLQELEDFTQSQSEPDTIISKWDDTKFIGDVEFTLIEPILSQRCVLLNTVYRDSLIKPTAYYLDIACKARIEHHFHIAERILHVVGNLNASLGKVETLQVQFEQAQLFWERNELEVARVSMRMILAKMKDDAACKKIYSQALRTYGTWQASTKAENLSSIISKYFEPGLKLLADEQTDDKLKTYDCLARYADEKHMQISEILKSIRKVQRPDGPSLNIEIRQQAIDEQEIATHESERKTYLHMAMEYYLKSLAEGNLIDIKTFRVVSLWLDNTEDNDLLDMLSKSILSVPSYKFVKVLPQLVARISNVQTKQNTLIMQVIEKCAVEHPHHTLPLIMAVANSLKDEIYLKKTTKNMPTKSAMMESRIRGAENLLMRLKKQDADGHLIEIIRQLDVLSLAYIIFANNFLGENRYSAAKHTIPASQQLMKIKDFDQICVSTINLKLSKEGVYTNVVGVLKFDKVYSIPGGVNEPKKIACLGTDGHRYIQLLKGKDDPRQDAVMQQVFTIMNDLLKHNKTACKRNLCVMTYKVVPLSQMSGVIEWCSSSQPLAAYLVGDIQTVGAHTRYNPQDMTHKKCRDALDKLHQTKASANSKLNTYLNICKKFQPVLRYFFLEHFKSPTEWHNMQTNYTRSVATSSMIGYILGLGDRHLNNILISFKTGQVIHIDFGIAFEQGLILPTPETVPFRLTRDVEDGMGVTGTEGTFKKTCETTLTVMREHTETLLTILEVLLYDPLYTWTLTPSKAAEKQKLTNAKSFNTESDVPVNKIAARALFRLKQKLQGIEEGSVFSVEGQTNILIQRARDPDNLCRLFPGWQPYL